MGLQEKTNFIKLTNFKLFGKIFFTKEEIYSENSSEGEAYKIIVNQDYFNQEFEIDNKSNDQAP